jgi:lysozyme
MVISVRGLALLKQSEGFCSRPYKDAAGYPTVGYGHKIRTGETFPDALTMADAELMLEADLLYVYAVIKRLVTVPLTQGQFDALVDFVYNLGGGRLADSTLLRDLNAGNYDAAADQLERWDHAGGIELPGLQKRRAAEFTLWHAPTPNDLPQAVDL